MADPDKPDAAQARQHRLYTPEGMEGVSACSVCNGAEGSLPQDCPGRRMTLDEESDVFTNDLEFIRGRWWVPRG